MAELRWILLFLGVVIVFAVYLYSRRERFGGALDALPDRREPVIDDPAPASRDEPDAAGKPAPPAETAQVTPAARKVFAVRLMSRDPLGFRGEGLVLSMRELGLRHGRYGIFHHLDDADDEPRYSVASLVEPGSFDLANLKSNRYPGISLFMTVPGPDDDVENFDTMMAGARKLAEKLDADLLDEQGSTLSLQRERYMREEVIQMRGPRGLD